MEWKEPPLPYTHNLPRDARSQRREETSEEPNGHHSMNPSQVVSESSQREEDYVACQHDKKRVPPPYPVANGARQERTQDHSAVLKGENVTCGILGSRSELVHEEGEDRGDRSQSEVVGKRCHGGSRDGVGSRCRRRLLR